MEGAWRHIAAYWSQLSRLPDAGAKDRDYAAFVRDLKRIRDLA
jgi:hypothetical protein